MEISTEINKKKNIRWHIVRDIIDISEPTECLKEIYNSPDSDPEMNVFWDLQKTDLANISTEDVRSFMEYVVKQWGTGRKSKAALVVSRDLEYGISRIFQMMVEGTTSRESAVFIDINEAQEWIGAET